MTFLIMVETLTHFTTVSCSDSSQDSDIDQKVTPVGLVSSK